MTTERDCFRAIAENKMDIVKAYLDINGIDTPIERGTALHQAVFENKPGIVEYLLKNGANPDLLYDDDITPLIAAIDLKFWDIAKQLIAAGADVNKQDKKGNSPLSKAIFHYTNDNGFIKLLLDRGVDPHKELVKGFTAIDMAINFKLNDMADLLKKQKPLS
jgi:ankyrin repeat protein